MALCLYCFETGTLTEPGVHHFSLDFLASDLLGSACHHLPLCKGCRHALPDPAFARILGIQTQYLMQALYLLSYLPGPAPGFIMKGWRLNLGPCVYTVSTFPTELSPHFAQGNFSFRVLCPRQPVHHKYSLTGLGHQALAQACPLGAGAQLAPSGPILLTRFRQSSLLFTDTQSVPEHFCIWHRVTSQSPGEAKGVLMPTDEQGGGWSKGTVAHSPHWTGVFFLRASRLQDDSASTRGAFRSL